MLRFLGHRRTGQEIPQLRRFRIQCSEADELLAYLLCCPLRPSQYPPARWHTASSRTSIRSPLKALYKRRHQRLLHLWRQFSRQQRFRPIHRHICRKSSSTPAAPPVSAASISALAASFTFSMSLCVMVFNRSVFRPPSPAVQWPAVAPLPVPASLVFSSASRSCRSASALAAVALLIAELMVFGVLAEKKGGVSFRKTPANQACHNREVNPLEDFVLHVSVAAALPSSAACAPIAVNSKNRK